MHHDLCGWEVSKQGKAKLLGLMPLPVYFCRRCYLPGHLPGVLSHGFEQPWETQKEEPAFQPLLQIAPSLPLPRPSAGRSSSELQERRPAETSEPVYVRAKPSSAAEERYSLFRHASARNLCFPWCLLLCLDREDDRPSRGDSRIGMHSDYRSHALRYLNAV